ncbi:MAG: hypothetical protein EPN69_00350 [Rhodanobacter sp.]|nr:MAG: hypothetical protein EPN71_14315 [Rhodanobacter sp.]TAL99497.1 MAG: hypothetical protein EPN69_00350 [Rhodanobacter sp.]
MNEDKSGWWAGIAAAAALSLCCGLPLLVAAFGAGAIAAIAKFGFAGLLVAGGLGVAIYLWVHAKRRRSCESCVSAPRQTPKGP